MKLKVDTALTVSVNILPLTDSTDKVTRETAITFDQAGMELYWNFQVPGSNLSRTLVTLLDGGNDAGWGNDGRGEYSIAILATGSAQGINNNTEGTGWFSGICDGVLPWRSPNYEFLPIKVIDSMMLGTDNLEVDAIQIDGTAAPNTAGKLHVLDGDGNAIATAEQVNSTGSGATGGTHVDATYDNTTRDTIDNASADLKGSGLVGIPVTGHSFVAGREITIAGSTAYNGAFEIISQTTNEVVITHAQTAEAFTGSETIVASIKGQVFVGTVTSGTFANVSAQQGDLHSIDDVGDDIDIIYGFNIGGSREATLIAFFVNVNGNTDEMACDAYDFVGDAFVPKKLIPGSGGSSFVELDSELIKNNTGTGTEIGDVFIRFRNNSTTPSSLDIDKCLLTAVGTNLLIGYPNGFEVSETGTSGTEFTVNGTAGNACPFADALAMNAVNPLNLFTIHNGEELTPEVDIDGISLKGEVWTLNLNSKSVASSYIEGAIMSGTATGADYTLETCTIGAVTMAAGTHRHCIYTNNTTGFTMGSTGTYFINDPRSGVAGNAAPVFTWDGSGTTKVNLRAISTGVQFEGMAAGDIATVEGWGQFIEGTCPGGAVTIRGCLTTSGITNITLTDEARFDVAQITGGAYSLDTDNNGRMRVVSGTSAGEIGLTSGAIDNVVLVATTTASTELASQLTTHDTTINGRLNTIDGILGTIVTDTTTEIPALIEALNDPTVEAIADGVLDEVNTGATHNIVNSLGRQIREGTSGVIGAFDVISATANTVTIDGSASAVSGSYDPSRVFVYEGTGMNQTGVTTEYFGSAGGNGNPARTLIFREDFKITLDNTSKLLILANDGRISTNQGQLRAGSTTSATLNDLAPSADISGQTLHFTSGTGQDQVALISSYAGPIATFETLDVAVNATTGYELLPTGCVNLEQIQNDAQSVTDLKDLVDTGYNPIAHSIVLVDTTTTVTNKTEFKLASDGLDLVTSWTVDITGSISGSVGSVTGDVGGITDTGLAEFMTVDTGQVTAAAGSVAKIAQGSAGGNVTVGDLTQAALAQFAADDTGETAAAAGSVAKLSQGSGSGSSIILQTTTLEAAPNLAIELDQNYAWSKEITAEDSQTGKDHVFAVYNRNDLDTLLWTLDTSHITVSGDDGKTLTIADDDANTGDFGTFYYELANTTDDKLVTAGSLTIMPRGDTVA